MGAMLTQTAEHALRALLFLARAGDGRPVPVEAVADAIGAPRNYLSKTLHALTKQGLVSGTRGPGGGYRLEADPEALTLLRIAEVFGAAEASPMCLLGGRPCDEARPCRAHVRWSEVQRQALDPLRHTTLADLLAGRAGGSGTERDEAR